MTAECSSEPGIANAASQPSAADAVVTVYENGPLIVRGQFTITSQDGQPIPAGRKTVALCRCGQSGLKPFCDGSHARTGFRAPAAPKAAPGDGACGPG